VASMALRCRTEFYQWFIDKGVYGELTLEHEGSEKGQDGGTSLVEVKGTLVAECSGLNKARVQAELPQYVQRYQNDPLKRRGKLKLSHRELRSDSVAPSEAPSMISKMSTLPALTSTGGRGDCASSASQASIARSIRARQKRRDQTGRQLALKPVFYSTHEKWQMRNRLHTEPSTRLPSHYTSPASRERRENADNARTWLAGDFTTGVGTQGSALDIQVVARVRNMGKRVVDPFVEAYQANINDAANSRRKWIAGPFKFTGHGSLSGGRQHNVPPIDPAIVHQIKSHMQDLRPHPSGSRTSRF